MRANPHIDELCDPSEALYHVTSFASLPSIAAQGLVPRSGGGTFAHGGYGEHSQGKVFMACGRDAALAWYGKVQDQLWDRHQDDEEPDAMVPVLLMVSPDGFSEAFVDEVGDRDVPGSVYVRAPIPADSLYFWSPADDDWVPVTEWDSEDPYLAVENIEHFDDEGDVVDEGDEWVSRGFEVVGPYDSGGYKPDPDHDDAWQVL